jgi:type II secretion system protein N
MTPPKASTILAATGLFFFFLLLEFPYQNLRGYLFGQIYKNTHIFITADDLSLTLFGWPGLKLYKVNISIPMGINDLELTSEKTVVRAGVGGLFPPYPTLSLSMQGLKKGGYLYVKLGQNSGFIKGMIESNDLALEQLPMAGLSEPLVGRLQADGNLVYDRSDLQKSQGELDLNLTKFRVPAQNLQGIVLAPMDIGTVKSKIIVKNGTLDLTNFQIGTPTSDIRGSLSGEVRLGKDVMASHINVVLKLQLSDKFRQNPQSATLVSLLQSYQNNTPGDYAMKWNATVNDMSSNLVMAIPQKAN